MLKSALLAAAAVAALAMPAVASAAILHYEIRYVGTAPSGYSFTFDLDTSRAPSFSTASTLRYAPTTITYSLPGSATVYTDTISNLGPSFFSPIDQGGVSILRLPRGTDLQPRFFQEPGNSLFTGPTSAPLWKTGIFQLSMQPKNVPSDVQTFDYRVTITDLSAVPEPATWGMMILGFGLVGAAMRMRRRKVSVFYA
jgi:hypothetical protein